MQRSARPWSALCLIWLAGDNKCMARWQMPHPTFRAAWLTSSSCSICCADGETGHVRKRVNFKTEDQFAASITFSTWVILFWSSITSMKGIIAMQCCGPSIWLCEQFLHNIGWKHFGISNLVTLLNHMEYVRGLFCLEINSCWHWLICVKERVIFI